MDREDAERYRFLRDNPLQLRAIDGNASPNKMEPVMFDSAIDHLIDEATGRERPKTPDRQYHPKPHALHGVVLCGAWDKGFYCTLASKHVEDHEAYAMDDTDMLHSWPQT